MQSFEFAVLDWIQANCRTGFLDAVMPVLSALCAHGEIWILLALALLLFKKHRRAGAAVAVALALDLVCCNVLLKPLIARVRPCDLNAAVELLVARPPDWSFPSGHTAASFAAVGALWAAGEKFWPAALALAAAIGLSRLYLYVHWPSDVLAGAGLGLLLGVLAAKLVDFCQRNRRNHTKCD